MQNGPVDEFTALTGTIFMTISVFVSRSTFCQVGIIARLPGSESLWRLPGWNYCQVARLGLPGWRQVPN